MQSQNRNMTAKMITNQTQTTVAQQRFATKTTTVPVQALTGKVTSTRLITRVSRISAWSALITILSILV